MNLSHKITSQHKAVRYQWTGEGTDAGLGPDSSPSSFRSDFYSKAASEWGFLGHSLKYLIPPSPENLFPSFFLKFLIISYFLEYFSYLLSLCLLHKNERSIQSTKVTVLFFTVFPEPRQSLTHSRGSLNIWWISELGYKVRGMDWMTHMMLSSSNTMILTCKHITIKLWITWEYLKRIMPSWPL